MVRADQKMACGAHERPSGTSGVDLACPIGSTPHDRASAQEQKTPGRHLQPREYRGFPLSVNHLTRPVKVWFQLEKG